MEKPRKIMCIGIKYAEIREISSKAAKITAFDGSCDIFPISQIPFIDYNEGIVWVAEWIMKHKDIQYSKKRVAWFNPATGILEPNILIEKHIPARHGPVSNIIDSLRK